MRLFGKSKSKEKEEVEVYQCPRLAFEVQEDGNIVISCSWPRPDNNQEAADYVQKFASLIYMSTTGKLLASTQQAIATFDTEDEISKQMSKAILAILNNLLESNGHSRFNANKPVISPRQCFAVRGSE